MTVIVPAASTAALATPAVAPWRAPPCTSDVDCNANQGGGPCMPNASTRELSDAEDFLERAMRVPEVTELHDADL